MGYIQGEGRNQATLFPVVLDDFVPADHVCRVIDAFVEKLVMSDLDSSALRPLRRDDLDTIRAIC
jgi:transposase